MRLSSVADPAVGRVGLDPLLLPESHEAPLQIWEGRKREEETGGERRTGEPPWAQSCLCYLSCLWFWDDFFMVVRMLTTWQGIWSVFFLLFPILSCVARLRSDQAHPDRFLGWVGHMGPRGNIHLQKLSHSTFQKKRRNYHIPPCSYLNPAVNQMRAKWLFILILILACCNV